MKPETPRCASPVSPPLWKPKRKKNYPHFDDHLNDKAIDALVTNKTRVARNAFLPFIIFKKRFNKFGKGSPRSTRRKTRELRYAARKDAYIYEYYRQELSKAYEIKLAEKNLSPNVIAYRKLKTASGRGMCSIDFAHDAFREIASRKDCVAIALDIQGYFESLDHKNIKQQWCSLLAEPKLPPDHFAVFKSITNYAQIGRDEVYKRLNIIEWDASLGRWKHTKKKGKIPTRLCSMEDFREKIAKPSGGIWTNWRDYGIPQGSPISDLIANFYLLDFDSSVEAFAQSIGGYYRRYCDDILIVFSADRANWLDVEKFIQHEIESHGAHLRIADKKTLVHAFSVATKPSCVSLKGGERRFEYLGFQFDGIEARFRDRTVSSFYRKLKWAIYSEARSLTLKYKGKPLSFISEKLDVSKLLERFGRRKGFADCDDVHQWTFWTYVTRSTEIMGPMAPRLYAQIANYKRFVRYHMPHALSEAHKKSI